MEKAGIFIISGRRGAGKTTRLRETVDLLKAEMPGLFGFYAAGEWENGRRKRFRIVDIRSGRRYLLCSYRKQPSHPEGTFVFYSKAIQTGETILRSGARRHGSLAVLDEIGPFELKGKVWHDALRYLLEQNIPLLFTLRENLLDEVLRYFGIGHSRIFTLAAPPGQIAAAITEETKRYGTKKGGKK